MIDSVLEKFNNFFRTGNLYFDETAVLPHREVRCSEYSFTVEIINFPLFFVLFATVKILQVNLVDVKRSPFLMSSVCIFLAAPVFLTSRIPAVEC